MNGVHHTNSNVFPEALKSLKEADPEIYGIIQDEKARQWWAPLVGAHVWSCKT